MVERAHNIVSSESEELILVDQNDVQTGTLSKAACHDGEGVLHRAFSLFIFNGRGELLLQQRSASKRLWPLFWSNSCCSHPRAGETMDEAVGRRLHQELGLSGELEFIYKFAYTARFGDEGSENELCSVFLGRTDESAIANANEIAGVRYVTAGQLDRELVAEPERFTPWFRMEWERLTTDYADRLAGYVKA